MNDTFILFIVYSLFGYLGPHFKVFKSISHWFLGSFTTVTLSETLCSHWRNSLFPLEKHFVSIKSTCEKHYLNE